ncbi:MAG: RNA polymerase subunit sigma-70 [Bacteroidetes bacterium]|nr:MAG: RNA polymerase subunit sigma-70 [Bacteroidota bacterium]PTM11040.1 MAG: RNA polymerase subunit sigma-70 [Bacteroidota bacterium]
MCMKDNEILTLVADPAQRERGFRLLVQCYGDRLYQHIRRLVSTHEDANDVLQNTLVKTFRHIGNFQAQSQLYTWLFRIATNEALSHLNQQKRRRAFVVLNDETETIRGSAAHSTQELEGEYIRQKLEQAMAKLPPKQKAIFSLRYFEEKSYAEMSAIFTTSEGALKASYHHAVKKIEAFLRT